MKDIKSDSDLVNLARRIQVLQFEISDLIHQIGGSEHSNAQAAYDDLMYQCWFAAWPEHVIAKHLAHPEQWECGNYGIRHKAATKAQESRKTNRKSKVSGKSVKQSND